MGNQLKFEFKIYSLKIEENEVALKQRYFNDKYDNFVANALVRCIPKTRTISFKEYQHAAFEVLVINNDYALVEYALYPDANSPFSSNRDPKQNFIKLNEKHEISDERTLFFINFETLGCAILNKNCKGFKENFQKILQPLNIKIESVNTENWRAELEDVIQTINGLEVKEYDSEKNKNYLQPLNKIGLPCSDFIYTSIKFKLKNKSKESIKILKTDVTHFEKFIIEYTDKNNATKSFDLIKKKLQKRGYLELIVEEIFNPSNNYSYIVNEFKKIV